MYTLTLKDGDRKIYVAHEHRISTAISAMSKFVETKYQLRGGQ